MGYETTLYVVENLSNLSRKQAGKRPPKKIIGYCSVLATVELCKCGYDGKMAELINTTAKKNKTEANKRRYNLTNKAEELEHRIFTHDCGDYNEGYDRDHKDAKRYFDLKRQLGEQLPYFYGIDGNQEVFFDRYGDALIVAEIPKVIEAMEADNTDEGGYRRYEMALPLLRAIIKHFETKFAKAILYGH